MDEDDIQLISELNNSNFNTNKLHPAIYTIKNLQEAVLPLGDHEGTLKFEYDDISLKTKLFETRFGSNLGTLRFDEKSFFNIFLGFTPHWDYKSTKAIYADSPGVHTSDEILILSTIDKIRLKCDVIDGSNQNGSRHPILFSLVSVKNHASKYLANLKHYTLKKINKSDLNTIKIYLKDDNNEEVDFNGETMIFLYN